MLDLFWNVIKDVYTYISFFSTPFSIFYTSVSFILSSYIFVLIKWFGKKTKDLNLSHSLRNNYLARENALKSTREAKYQIAFTLTCLCPAFIFIETFWLTIIFG